MPLFQKPEPLKITCTMTDCDNDLHCFKATQKMPVGDRGKCRACNADLVDWTRIHNRSIGDAKYTFQALKRETIRHHFFHVPIDQKAINYAKRKGRKKLKDAIRARVQKSIGSANPSWDGRQTPMSDNPIFYGQHATATCCRTCLEYWHDIPKGVPLTEEQIDYCVEILELFFDERLPEVDDNPVHVPPIRR
ncbi:hypothetical protein PB2503_12534 [Parvularcula bermudensis HTCC2503]|uniref:DUF4186 family protein n=1 Tax=Parvularcula bermudensis (strain ATCC BAA-594 / HTCC2503 / KCTC 12087) TaxID=314260 RepID=E0TFI7_PARBH|nr:DUF4186 domain-containing protein [Parvularcula bermudensis]ADM10547.1 hypothetical protein PB2503_12534 [Parvularcula bermudensis HTCC2503]